MLSDIVIPTTFSLTGLLIGILILAGAIAIFLIVMKVLGLTVPPWLVQIFWVIVAVVVGVFAIKLVVSMW